MLKRLILSLAIAVPLAATGFIAGSSTAQAQWGGPPPPHHGWGGPPPPHRWGPPPPPRWGWRPPPPPPRCWTERQRVWVDGPYGPRRVVQRVRVCA